MRMYSLTIIYNGDTSFKYKFTNVMANNKNDAVAKMKEYVATHGWFGNMSHDEIVNKLSAIDVTEIEISKE